MADMEIAGLPLHPLLVHGVVVLLPLLALGTLAYVLRPRWRRVLAWPLLVGTVVTVPLTVLAKSAGENLEQHMGPSELIDAHAQWGDVLGWLTVGYGLVLLVALLSGYTGFAQVAWLRWSRRLQQPTPAKLAPVAAALLALAVLVVVVLAGHSGAAAAWTGWRNR